MSFAAIYTLEFTDYFDRDIQVLIEDESGDANVDVKGSDNPLTLSWNTPSDFILDPINGSSATIRLMSETDFQFLDLYTNSNRKYQVTIKIDTVLEWRGFLSPDQYQEQYKQTPYATEFVAMDQLGFLKTLAWDNLDIMTLAEALGFIFEKTDLELDLYEGLNIYEYFKHNRTTADSPLDQTYFDGKAYDGKTYYDVLYDTLLKFGAVVKQDRGHWFIYRPIAAVAAFQRRLWTYSAGVFTYDSTASYDPVVDTTSATVAKANLVRITAGSMFISPAWQKYTLTRDYIKRANSLENGDFSEWDDPIPDSWTKSGSIILVKSTTGLRINAVPGGSLDYITQMFNSVSNVIKLKFRYAVFVAAGQSLTVSAIFYIIRGGTRWYWDFDARQWTVNTKYYRPTIDNSGGSTSVGYIVEYEDITEDASLSPGDEAWFRIDTPGGHATGYVDWQLVNTNVLDVFDEEYESELIEDITINPDNNYKGDDLEILVSDAPHPGNVDQESVYYGILTTNAAMTEYTSHWTTDGSHYFSLSLHLKRNISELKTQSAQVISVPIYSKLLFSSSVIQELNNANRLFMIRRATWDVLNGIWDVEAFEIGMGAGAALKAEDGTDLLAEDGQTLLA